MKKYILSVWALISVTLTSLDDVLIVINKKVDSIAIKKLLSAFFVFFIKTIMWFVNLAIIMRETNKARYSRQQSNIRCCYPKNTLI
ncbi:MAG: hypothetical protein EOP33_01595 [Rickettsiaceae bacterium]|nr:MAG: hypothetical protein EOP33_01595 [Rickettsiaceae bacterium]